ncbi:MAG: hypothetical protein AAFV88_22860 [Planctomycetota bacterium]
MANVTSAFDENRGAPVFRCIDGDDGGSLPWQAVRDGQLPPMMFQVRLSDGTYESFPFGDIRRVRCRDAGAIQMETFSSPRTQILIEGRHLRDLASLLSAGMVRWIAETDSREVDRPEELPTITSIAIELFPVSQTNQ